jgi:hypothetical protein
MFNTNSDQYDIQVITVDPSDWSVKRVGVYANVADAIANHPSSDGLGDWLEGGISDVNFDDIPEYHAIELIRGPEDTVMYLAMKGTRQDRFNKAMIEAVEHRKDNPKRTKIDLAADVHRYLDYLIDDFIHLTGYKNRDILYQMVSFLLLRLGEGSIPSDGSDNIPPFLLIPSVSKSDNDYERQHGRRAYEDELTVACSQYDILSHMLPKLLDGHPKDFTEQTPLDLDHSETRAWLKKDWEEVIRNKICKCFKETIITPEEAKTLPMDEVLTRLFQYAYPDPVSIGLANWAVVMDIAHDLQVDIPTLIRKGAVRRHQDPNSGWSKGTLVEDIEDTFKDEYCR